MTHLERGDTLQCVRRQCDAGEWWVAGDRFEQLVARVVVEFAGYRCSRCQKPQDSEPFVPGRVVQRRRGARTVALSLIETGLVSLNVTGESHIPGLPLAHVPKLNEVGRVR